ncbi:hypothetical protein HNP70_001150 [Borreliella kurtenbachii]|uniref:hypothetical protein n=1 Tax=Borreliella kurtenbachii TaxID=1196056 RepID=UPI003E32CB76
MGKFKGKLCIYQTSRISYSLIDAYFSSTNLAVFKKIKSNKEKLKPKNVTQNVTVNIKNYKNIYNKNSIKHNFKKNSNEGEIRNKNISTGKKWDYPQKLLKR